MYPSSNDFKSYRTSNNVGIGAGDTTSSATKLTSYSRSRSVDDINRSNQIGTGNSADRRFKTMARDYKSYRDSNGGNGDLAFGATNGTGYTGSLQACNHHGVGEVKDSTSSYLRGRDRSTKDSNNSKVLTTEESGVDRRSSKNQYRIVGRITRSPSPADGTRFKTTTSHNRHISGDGDGTKTSSKFISSNSGGATSSSYLRDKKITSSAELATTTGGAEAINYRGGGGTTDKGRLTRDGISILGGSSKGYQIEDFNNRGSRGGGGLVGGTYCPNKEVGSGYLPGEGSRASGYGRTGNVGGPSSHGGPREDLQLPFVRHSGTGGGGVSHQGRGMERNRFVPLSNTTHTSGLRKGGSGIRPRNDNSYDRHISPERSYTDDGLQQQSRPHQHHRSLNRQRSRGGRPFDRRRMGSKTRPSVRRSRSMNDLLGGGRRSPSPSKRGGGGGNMDLNDSFPVCKRFPNCSVCVIDIPLKQQNSVRCVSCVLSLFLLIYYYLRVVSSNMKTF